MPSSSGTTAGSQSTESAGAKPSGGLSSGATAGIVATVCIAAAILVVFLVRKTFIRRRQRKRNTWGAGAYPYDDKDSAPMIPERLAAPAIDIASRTPNTATSFGNVGMAYSNGGMTPQTTDWQRGQMVSPSPATPAPMTAGPMTPSFYVTPPPTSYNNPAIEDAYGGIGSAPGSATAFGSQYGGPGGVETAVVKVVYVPTLPDELSISAGEIVRVIRAFDDGWAMCQNSRGEQGVAPLECLDRSNSYVGSGVPQGPPANSPMISPAQESAYGNGSDWRNMKRFSSLSNQSPNY